jgi:hypothetical protein
MFLCVYSAGVIAGVAQDCPLAEPVASQRLRSGGLGHWRRCIGWQISRSGRSATYY